MKSNKSRELKVTNLAQAMAAANVKDNTRKQIIQGVVIGLVVFLAVFLIRRRMQTSADLTSLAGNEISRVREGIAEINSPQGRQGYIDDPSLLGQQFGDLSRLLDTAEQNGASKNPAVETQLLLTRAELNWTAHAVSTATTQPTGIMQSNDDLLNAARDAYGQVLARNTASPFAVAEAHMGLAAVAEDQNQFDEARTQYNAVIDDSTISDTFKQIAGKKLAMIDKIKLPIVIAQAPTTQSSEDASTQPAMSEEQIEKGLGMPMSMGLPSSLPTTSP